MSAEAGKTLCQDWLSRLSAGNHTAFAEFVDKYKHSVFLCCRTLGLDDDEVEDAASETFLAAYKGLSQYKGRAQLGTWLWRIAYRQAVNYLRKNRNGREQLLDEPSEQLADNKQPEASAAIHCKEQERLIWDAVRKLPRLWAMAVILFYREEKSIKDIAKIMQVRQNTVKTYLFRARQKLKEIIQPRLGEDIDADR